MQKEERPQEEEEEDLDDVVMFEGRPFHYLDPHYPEETTPRPQQVASSSNPTLLCILLGEKNFSVDWDREMSRV